MLMYASIFLKYIVRHFENECAFAAEVMNKGNSDPINTDSAAVVPGTTEGENMGI